MSPSVQERCLREHLPVETSGPALNAMFLNTGFQALLRNRLSIMVLFVSGDMQVPYIKAKQAVP